MSANDVKGRPGALPGGIAELLVVALPMVISHSCETLMMFTDRLFLARLGPEQMSAAMGGGLTCFMFITFFIGLTGYSTAMVAQHLGAGQRNRCASVIGQALWVSLLSYPVILLAIPLGLWLFRATGIAPVQLGPQDAYFKILMFSAIIGLVRNSLSGFFSGIGRTRVVMISTIIAMIVNIIMNYVLIFGHLGFPAMGIAGAAIGTVIGNATGLLVLAGCYFSREQRAEFGVVGALRFDRPLMAKLLRLGYPAGLELFLNIMAFNLLVLSFHSYGVAEAAAITITFNWNMVTFVPLLGMNIAVTSLVGRHMGARNPDTAHRSTMSGLKLACGYSALMLVVYCFFPGPLVQVFRPEQDAASFVSAAPLAVFMIRLISVYVFADAVTLVFGGALRGAGDTFKTMLISVGGHWGLALGAIAMIRWFGAGPRATWVAIVVSTLILGGLFLLRYYSGAWRTIRVVDEAPGEAEAAR